MQIISSPKLLEPSLPERHSKSPSELSTAEIPVVKEVMDRYVSSSTALGAVPLGGAAVGALRSRNCLLAGHTRAASEYALSSALNLAGVATFCTGFFVSDPVTTGCGLAFLGLGSLAARTAASSHIASYAGMLGSAR